MFKRTFWREITLFGKRTSFSSFREFEQNVLRALTTSFWTRWSQMDSRCAEAQFEEKEFSSKKIIISLFLFRNLSDKSVVFWREIFGRFVKIAFFVARESFLMKKKLFCSKNCNFNNFGVRESFSYSWERSYGRLSKISLYMFRRTFWGEICFLESLYFFFIISGVRAKSFQSFDEKFFAGLSQLHSTRTLEQFEEIYYPFEKFPIFSSSLESELQICGFLEKSFC